MQTFINICKKAVFLHGAVLFILIPLSAAGLIYSFLVLGGEGIVCYASYVLSAYTLTALSFKAPKIIAFFKRMKSENKIIATLLSDRELRISISLYSSLFFNICYALFQLGIGLWHRSVWFYSISAYYFILALMRLSFIRYLRGHTPGEDMTAETRRYRFAGILLLPTSSSLSAIVFFVAIKGYTFVHHPITTIVMALYTFTSLTVAIVSMIKYKKLNSPIFSAVKAISFVSALVSLLTLEAAMLTAFGNSSEESLRSIMTAMTGAAVLLIVIAMAIYMIYKSTKALKKTT